MSGAGSAWAANGDCSIPITNGDRPASSDCLKILNVAVGLGDCSPHEACICAPKGTLPTTSTDALLCLAVAVRAPGTLRCDCLVAASTTTTPTITTSTTSTTSTTIPPGPECGNGVVEVGEQCDGTNPFIDDCCASDCTFETGSCNPPDQCSSAGTCSQGVCNNATPVPDIGEPNNRFADAFDLGDLTSGDEDAAVLGGALHPGSEDWYVYHVSDEIDSVVDPSISPFIAEQGPTLQFCIYYACDSGQTSLGCPIGTSPDLAGNVPGCCSLGSSFTLLPNCEGTIDDSGSAYIQVRHINNLNTCTSYSIGYRG